MGFKIVTDTCCNLPSQLIAEYDLTLLPLEYYLDGKEYFANPDDMDNYSDFYERLRNGAVATTSLVSRKVAEPILRDLLAAGNDILYIGFSTGLSGTYNMVSLILKDLQEEFPDRKVFCVDTRAASAGQGLFIHYVHKKKMEGATIEECTEYADSIRDHIAHWFTVSDLKFLARGGRISKTSATLGTALAIKPVMHMDNPGHLILMYKVRGRKKSIAALADEMGKLGVPPLEDQTVFISHGDCVEDAETLSDMLIERFHLKTPPLITYVDPVIGAHSGPGTLALFFLAKHK